MATTKELSAWLCEHYRYELLMLRYTHSRINNLSNQLEWNAHFESCAMHARNLRDFYCNKGDSNNRKASDYGATNIAKPNEISGPFSKINEQMDHPSKNRPYTAKNGKLTLQKMDEIVNWLEEKHRIFIDQCDIEKKEGWDEGLAIPASQITIQGNASPSATNDVFSISSGDTVP